MSDYTIMVGDCLELLRRMPDSSVDSVVTDPPYGLSFMRKKWDYDVPATEVWVECLRVLKPGGHLLAFAGTRTQHRMAVRIEDAGFEIRDMIAWVYGSGFPKSRNIGNDVEGMDGWGTALKPSMEPITFARKPLDGKTIGANVRAFGVGALNIDGCRIETIDDLNGGAYTLNGRQSVSDSLRQGSGMNAVGATAGEYVQPSGRWPANLIHDGSAEVVALFPAQAGAAAPVTGNEPTANGFSGPVKYSGMRERVPGAFHSDSGSAARFFYCAKTSRKDRNEGLISSDAPAVAKDATMRDCETAEWSTRNGNSHPRVKPTDLMAYLLRLVTPPGGVALDPFMGSGSTGKAAMREGFQFIGCEIDEQYAAIARARIDHEITRQQELQAESDQLDLFGTA
ncbi:site-specific DNA-methyltransferase [Pseudomonas atacamensis]|uniref:DNA-methyltransferase n=1 Tax=Pseudomonas atacamensis TaxID=2565368 RepID=UPI00300E7A64